MHKLYLFNHRPPSKPKNERTERKTRWSQTIFLASHPNNPELEKSWSKPLALNTCRFSNSTINKPNVCSTKPFAFLSLRKKTCPTAPCLQEKSIEDVKHTGLRLHSGPLPTSWKAFTESSSWKPSLSSETCAPHHLQQGLKHDTSLKSGCSCFVVVSKLRLSLKKPPRTYMHSSHDWISWAICVIDAQLSKCCWAPKARLQSLQNLLSRRYSRPVRPTSNRQLRTCYCGVVISC
jgi:hypothetical protein